MRKLILILAVAPILIISACNNSTSNSEKTESAATTTSEPSKDTTAFQAIDTAKLVKGAVFYQCSMHPEIIADKPGDCPKCGMALVQKQKSD